MIPRLGFGLILLGAFTATSALGAEARLLAPEAISTRISLLAAWHSGLGERLLFTECESGS